jgi:formylglycine-generating enzyme required for sulfatase activity
MRSLKGGYPLRLAAAVGLLLLWVTAWPVAAQEEMAEELVNSIGMTFRLVPGGTFPMGSNSAASQPDEQPIHDVTVSSFYMSAFEVTQDQYERVMGENPSGYGEPNHPVIRVTWHDAAAFCERLSEMDGRVYRLPTEAEWEFSARAGHYDGEYVWGAAGTPLAEGIPQANVKDDSFAAVPEYKRFLYQFGSPFRGYNDGYEDLAPVGSFPANAFGLHDMGGNVAEWCLDVYGLYYYRESPADNPTGPEEGLDRTMRGGSWMAGDKYARVTGRFRDAPTLAAATIGFRCVLVIERAPSGEGTGNGG